MALDAISRVAYKDTTNNSQKITTNTGIAQDTGAANIIINELLGITKATESNQTGNEQNKGQKESSASQKQIKDAVSMANNKLKLFNTRCEFAYHDDINRISIKVIDKDTDEVIKEIPSEDTLEMINKLMELAGLIVDEKR